jgi:hypothetical protein
MKGGLPQCSRTCISIRPMNPELRTQIRGTSGPPVVAEAAPISHGHPTSDKGLTFPQQIGQGELHVGFRIGEDDDIKREEEV